MSEPTISGVTLHVIRNRDRYTGCASCRATASHVFVWRYGSNTRIALSTSTCQRHAELWAKRLREAGPKYPTWDAYLAAKTAH